MEFRNAQYAFVDSDIIECEVNHPDYGWVPIALNSSDPATADMHAHVLETGPIAPAEEQAGPVSTTPNV